MDCNYNAKENLSCKLILVQESARRITYRAVFKSNNYAPSCTIELFTLDVRFVNTLVVATARERRLDARGQPRRRRSLGGATSSNSFCTFTPPSAAGRSGMSPMIS